MSGRKRSVRRPASYPVRAVATSNSPPVERTSLTSSRTPSSSSTTSIFGIDGPSASDGIPFSFMKLTRSARGILRNRDPGTRNPPSRPRSKQRMMVCCETPQTCAASPVVKTCLPANPRSPSTCELTRASMDMKNVMRRWKHRCFHAPHGNYRPMEGASLRQLQEDVRVIRLCRCVVRSRASLHPVRADKWGPDRADRWFPPFQASPTRPA